MLKLGCWAVSRRTYSGIHKTITVTEKAGHPGVTTEILRMWSTLKYHVILKYR